MSYTDGIISQPVSVRDVQRCLGSSSGDVATLCMRDNINMWSFRKPIYSTKIGILSEDDWKGDAHTLSGYKTGGGIKKAIVTGSVYLNSIISGTGGNVPSAIWTHDKPLNDGICYKRLADFAGYHHLATPSFSVERIYGNISSVIVPSSGSTSDTGSTIGFAMKCKFTDGSVAASQLFTDCYTLSGSIKDYFYPGVIMTCAGDDKLNYVKTAAHTISYYMNNTSDTVIEFTISTRLFMNKMTSDWSGKHSGDPYGNFPFRTGDMWTACLVLVSKSFDGGVASSDSSYTGGYYKLSDSDKIIRLEYAAPTNDVYVDRRTLPLKQSKFNNIEWMKLRVKVSFIGSQSSSRWQLTILSVTASMLTTGSTSFTINAVLSTASGGTVSVNNVGSGQSVTANNYSTVTFSGTTGEVTKNLTFPETIYDVTGTSGTGNRICAGNLTFVHSTLGSFVGSFTIDTTKTEDLDKEIILF